jgi:hypothetical protein
MHSSWRKKANAHQDEAADTQRAGGECKRHYAGDDGGRGEYDADLKRGRGELEVVVLRHVDVAAIWARAINCFLPSPVSGSSS